MFFSLASVLQEFVSAAAGLPVSPFTMAHQGQEAVGDGVHKQISSLPNSLMTVHEGGEAAFPCKHMERVGLSKQKRIAKCSGHRAAYLPQWVPVMSFEVSTAAGSQTMALSELKCDIDNNSTSPQSLCRCKGWIVSENLKDK